MYGWPALQSESPHVEHIRNIVNHVASAAVPGAFLVEVIPLMRYIPSCLARWKREGLVWHEKTAALFANYYQDAGKQFVGQHSLSNIVVTVTNYIANKGRGESPGELCICSGSRQRSVWAFQEGSLMAFCSDGVSLHRLSNSHFAL